MRHSLLVLLPLLASVATLFNSCSCGSYTLEGTVSDELFIKDGYVVTLFEEGYTGEPIPISTLPFKDGKFTYKGKADKLKVFSVVYMPEDENSQEYSYGVSFIPEANSHILVSLTSGESTATGSDATDAFSELQEAVASIYSDRIEDINAAVASADEFALDSLTKVVSSELSSVYRMAFDTNTDNAVGLISLVNLIYDTSLPAEEVFEYTSRASKGIMANEMVQSAIASLTAAQATSSPSMFTDFEGTDKD